MQHFRKKLISWISRGIIVISLIFLIGGVGGVFFDQYVLPKLRTNRFLSRIDFLKKTAENVTVINNTQQITVKEDDLINEISSQTANVVVNIVSINTSVQPKTTVEKALRKDGQSGTGVIATSDGLVVTYRSAIIEHDAAYKVFLFNGAYYDATLVGIDEFTDLAYLKIEASNLTSVSFANSNDFHPGRKLIAIGNSFGEYQNRFSAGLLSNNDRTFNLSGQTVSSSDKLEGVFESDFKDLQPYIGGPIIGYSGELVGIIGGMTIDNRMQYFQIPSNMVRKSLDIAVRGEFGSRPTLGAYYVSITKEYAIVHNLHIDRGALIWSPSGKQGLAILSGSIAESAGLKINDIVTMVNDQGVNLDSPFSNLLAQYKKGDRIELTVLRGETELKLPMNL